MDNQPLPIAHVPIFANRHVAIASQFAFAYMNMASLLAWRVTCRDAHLLATKHLRQSLHALLARFFPDPSNFLQLLTRWGGLIVGEAAVSLVVNDLSICTTTLELAVGNLVFESFVLRLSKHLPLGTHVVARVDKPAPPSFPSLRNTTRIAEFGLTTGLFVHIYESATPSACAVVSGTWTTALMNFVTASSLGCAYPRLTLNYRGFLCDGRTDAKRWQDYATHARLQTKGFQFAHYSQDWPTYSSGPYSDAPPSASSCGQSIFVCPFQGRYFGDQGSLIIFFDGFYVDLDELCNSYVAPYGQMTAWRIPTQGTCDGRCVEDESILPAFVISMLFKFLRDRSPTDAIPDVARVVPPPMSSSTAFCSPTGRAMRRSSV